MIERRLENMIERYYEHIRDMKEFIKNVNDKETAKEIERDIMKCESRIMELEHGLKILEYLE